MVLAWGAILIMGVTDPLGGINTLFPLFGIANQLFAAIALTIVFTVLIKKRLYKWAWIPGPPVGLGPHRDANRVVPEDLLPGPGDRILRRSTTRSPVRRPPGAQKFGTASSPAAIDAVVRNTLVQGTLSIIFASLVIIVVIAAAVVCLRSIRAGGMPTTEEPEKPPTSSRPAVSSPLRPRRRSPRNGRSPG